MTFSECPSSTIPQLKVVLDLFLNWSWRLNLQVEMMSIKWKDVVSLSLGGIKFSVWKWVEWMRTIFSITYHGT